MWNKITGFVGPTGSGKSHEAARIFGESERAAVYQVVRKDMAFLNVASDWFDGDIKAFCVALAEPEFKYVYRVADGGEELAGNKYIFPDFNYFLDCCFKRENMRMTIDEAHFLCSVHYMPAKFRKAVVTGRHAYLDVDYITQSLAMIHRDLRMNTHEFRFWHITEPADLAAIAERCGDDIAVKVSSLRRAEDNRKTGGGFVPGQMLVWDSHTKASTVYDMRSMQAGRANGEVRGTHVDAPTDANGDNGSVSATDGTDANGGTNPS